MHTLLKKVIDNIVLFDEAEWATFHSAFDLIEIPPRHLLTDIGQIEKKIYFVVAGTARLYCMSTKAEEANIFLFSENMFASCYQSFLTQTPSDQALESIEGCTLLALSKTSYDRLHKVLPKMNLLTRIIAEQRFINAQRIFTSHITHTPEERYLQFERLQGHLMLRIPQNIIASFLGITPVSLSRIRRRVSKK